MNRPSDPILNELAHEAENIQWGIPFEGIEQQLQIVRQGGQRLPKHVKQFPNNSQRAMAGLYVGGKYRILAYCPTVETAARMADVLVVSLDEYRKHGIRNDKKAAEAELNFPLEAAHSDLRTCEPLKIWVDNLVSYLVSAGMLKEKGFSPAGRTGRPQSADAAGKLRERLESIELKLANAQRSLDTILLHVSTRVTIGPAIPATPGDYPFVTTGSDIPKATS